jgi:hypothetical protein
MRHVAVAMALGLSGCTVIGGVTGGLLASHHNGDLPPDHTPDQERSTPLWIVIPAVVGLVLDLTYLNYVGSQWSKPMT